MITPREAFGKTKDKRQKFTPSGVPSLSRHEVEGIKEDEAVTVVVILFICWFFVTGCGEKIKPSVLNVGMSAESPSQESWNTSVTFSDSGRVKAILHAGYIAQYRTRQVTEMSGGVKVDFFDPQERHTSVLTSDSAVVNDQTHDLEALRNVTVVSDSGTTLRTEELIWTNATRKIHTPKFVHITSASEDLQGTGLESDQSLKNYSIFKVSGESRSQK